MLKVGIPSSSSRFFSESLRRSFEILRIDSSLAPNSRQMAFEVQSEALGNVLLVLCRGRDLATYTAAGYLDIAFTGYDAWVDSALRDNCENTHNLAWHVGSERPGRLVLAASSDANLDNINTVWSEYPGVTSHYLGSRGSSAKIIHVRGSVEGIKSTSRNCGCVTTVGTGTTLEQNGLGEIDTILTSDLCAVISERNLSAIPVDTLLSSYRPAALPSFVKT